MTRNSWLRFAVVIVTAAAWLGGPAAADDIGGGGVDTPMTVTEEVLSILKDDGRISEAKHRELLERHHREMAAVAAAAASSSANAGNGSTPPVSAGGDGGPEDWKVSWRNGLRLERNDGLHKLRIGGRFSNDWTVVGYSDGIADAIGMSKGRIEGGTEIRRARIFFEGTVWDRIGFKAQYDFADEDATGDDKTEFKDMWISMNGLGPLGTLRVGYQKEPFSLEELNSGKDISFMERSLVNALVPDRGTGFLMTNAPLDERMTWALGVFRDVDDLGRGFGKDAPFNMSGRITGLPIWADEGRHYLHLGASYSHQFRGDEATERYRSDPESNQARDLVDTRLGGVDLATRGQDLLGTELAYTRGPWHLHGEFVGSWVNRKSDSNPFFWGVYAQASYFLTGEHRPYGREEGILDRVHPRNTFNPSKGHWGAWEIAMRYSHLDLSDSGVTGGVLNDVTLGLNWYLFHNLRWFLNYVYSDRVGEGATNLAQMRFLIYY